MFFFLLFLICHLCPVHEVSADVFLLPVQLTLLPVNLFKKFLNKLTGNKVKCIVLLSTEYFYAVQHLISWLNLIHLIPQPNALTSGHPRGSPPGNP